MFYRVTANIYVEADSEPEALAAMQNALEVGGISLDATVEICDADEAIRFSPWLKEDSRG